MIHRTYVVLMPTSSPTTPLDIVPEGFPGTQAAPIKSGNAPSGWNGTDGAYYEWTGRALLFPNKLSLGTSQFIPRLRLGWTLALHRVNSAAAINTPGVQYSKSFVNSLASTDSGPSINIPSFADPSYGPSIRLTGSANTAGAFYIVHLQVMQARDNDRLSTGR